MKTWKWPALVIMLLAGCDERSALPTAPHAAQGTATAVLESSCSRTSVGLTPLNEFGNSPFPGVPLGLYPGGTNQIPSGHLSAGLELASSVRPLDANGAPDPDGRLGLISIGMSNTTQEFSTFIAMSPSPNPRLALIDGAQSGQTAGDWANPTCPCWRELDERVRREGLTNAQVVAAWIKLANPQPTGEWPTAAQELQRDTTATLRILAARFPKLRLAYLSSRVYGGYASTPLNPEPYAYQGGFAVRSVIETQLSGRLPFRGTARVAPWIAWGPYLWADGLKPRRDGLTWACSDFAEDGTHPGPAGRQKVAQELRDFFATHPTTRHWFLGRVDGAPQR